MRLVLDQDPFAGRPAHWMQAGQWPCHWIAPPQAQPGPLWACRLKFKLESATKFRLHISADEKYQLYLDGAAQGRGPERGDLAHWFFDSYEFELSPGEHVLAPKVWCLGPASPRSQITLRTGFLCAPEDDSLLSLLGTGHAKWQTRPLPGWSTQQPFTHTAFSIGFNTRLDGAVYPWDWLAEDEGWSDAETLESGSVAGERNRHGEVHLLRPASLPAQNENPHRGGVVRHIGKFDGDFASLRDIPVLASENLESEAALWENLPCGEAAIVPPNTARRVLIDLRDYVCAYPILKTSGGSGAHIRLHWAESLFEEAAPVRKGTRSEIEGKFFFGNGDEFDCPGGEDRAFEPPFWRAGRYLELAVVTGGEPLTLGLELISTGYPMEVQGEVQAGEPWDEIAQLCERTVLRSCHDAFTDGPYYEQMTWAGDCLQNVLALFAISDDVRPVRKALDLFAASRAPEGHHGGLVAARWPAKDRLHIAPYALYWVALLHEYAHWRDDLQTVRRLMPAARSVLDNFRAFFTPDDILGPPSGWNFVDWVSGWPDGIPAGADRQPSAILNWQLVWTYSLAANLETALNEPELAARWYRLGHELSARLSPVFWKREAGLFSDDPAGESFSEHAQVFALLSGYLDTEKRRILERRLCDGGGDVEMSRCTLSFAHHLFEAYRRMERPDALLQRLRPWTELPGLGFLTTPEAPEPARSDCHAWSAHPLYHLHASFAGIRPGAPGFAHVAVEPQLGTLEHLRVVTPHPAGVIRAEFRQEEGIAHGQIELPEGIGGHLTLNGRTRDLVAGRNEF